MAPLDKHERVVKSQKMRNLKSGIQKCPICLQKIKKPNVWVRYHIRYSPPLVVLACRYCNGTERALRRRQPLKPAYARRAQKVLEFHQKVLSYE